MKTTLSLTLLALIIISGCKTREDIAREKMVDQMNVQMKDSQQLSADFTVRLQNLEDKLSNVTGQVEEGQHETKMTFENRLKELEAKIATLEEGQKLQETTLSEIKTKADANSEYLKEVLSGLKKISGGSSKRGKKGKKLGPYDDAMADYKRGRYKSAKQKLLTLLEGNKVKGSRKARVIHNLGMISFINKDNDKALAYFSRLFSEFPKTGYNKNGLLFMAKTFKRMKKNEEAKQTLNELISRFPKAKQVKEAKKLLSSL